MFYGRNASAFQRLKGYSKEFSPDELQLSKKQIEFVQKLCLSLISSLLSPSILLFQWNMQTRKCANRTKCLTSLFLDNWLQISCLCWHSVHVWSLRPQTAKPSRFLKDHEAWEITFTASSATAFSFFGVESALRSLRWLTYLKSKQKEKKKR